MASEGLGEMFEGDSADTCGEKILLVLMVGWADRQACIDVEQGPPSALAEFVEEMLKKNSVRLQYGVYDYCI